MQLRISYLMLLKHIEELVFFFLYRYMCIIYPLMILVNDVPILYIYFDTTIDDSRMGRILAKILEQDEY